jgi:DNA uptake protein ComE-like DNA-binding protein
MPYQRKRWTLALVVLLAAGLLSPGAALAAKAKAPKVDLNTASQKELEDLPGVGAATASKIIAGRPYSKVSDLEKAGVPKSTIDKIQKQVTVSKAKAAPAPAAAAPAAEKTDKKSSKSEKATSSSKAPETQPAGKAAASSAPVNLNTASQKELEDLPGVGPATAKKIIAGRPYSSVDDLAKAGVSKSTIGKISSLVTAGPAAASKPAAQASSNRAPAPASSAPASSSSAPASSSAKAPEAKPAAAAEAPRQPPPAKGMVWVNTATKIYHYEGDRWYGNTKEGKYMTEDEAIKAGYRASKEGQKKQ